MNMEEKDKIKDLLKMLSEKLKKPENKELMNGFLNELSPLFTTGEQRIDDIYEMCIEKIIKEQAAAFYKNFPLKDKRETLERDYIRMERARRKDDFEDFCMAVYQQIECMVNRIGNDPILNTVAERLYAYPAYCKDGNIKDRPDSQWLVSHMVFGKGDYSKYKQSVASLYAMDKFKCILYFVCYKASPENSDYRPFLSICSDVEDIYKYRNKNHRGNENTEDEIKIYNRIDPIQSFYYLKIIGLLARIVEMIQTGYPLSQELINYANSLEKKELPSQIKVVTEGRTKKILEKKRGVVKKIGKDYFKVRIDSKLYDVKKQIKDGIVEGDVIEIDGYEIVISDNISLSNYTKL